MELIAKFAVTVSHVARSVKCNTETCWIEKKTHFLTPCRVGSTAPARSFPVRHTAAFTATFKQQMALIFTNRCSLPSADIAFILHFAFLLIFFVFPFAAPSPEGTPTLTIRKWFHLFVFPLFSDPSNTCSCFGSQSYFNSAFYPFLTIMYQFLPACCLLLNIKP